MKTWGPWGSTMAFAPCFITHFARYGAAGYPFINGLDNCYASQYANGFGRAKRIRATTRLRYFPSESAAARLG